MLQNRPLEGNHDADGGNECDTPGLQRVLDPRKNKIKDNSASSSVFFFLQWDVMGALIKHK